MKILKVLLTIATVFMLLACGGGNKVTTSGGTSSSGSVVAVTPASVEVLASSNTLASAGSEVVVTAFVKDVSNLALSGQTVSFSATSGTLQVTSSVSDSSGAVTAKLSAGSNKALRSITVTVTASSATGSVVIPVTDTSITVTGNGSLQLNATGNTYTVRAVDSVNNPISGASIAVSSALGNAVSPASLTTNASGVATFGYTPSISGTDTLTVSGLGTTGTASVIVNAIDFVVLSPASNTSIAVGANQDVTVRYKNSNVGVPGQTVTFTTTRGTFAPGSSSTDGSGDASATLSSTTAGPATVLAQIAGVGQVSLPVLFVAGAPATVVLQASPGAVLPNSAGATGNQSTIQAVVRDASGNAVANTQVAFSAVQDLSNGNLSPGVAMTDVNGRAQVQFIPGASSTAANGVIIKAEAGTPVVSGTTTLTVNGSALFITIAFGNTMAELDTTTYTKTFSVYVTDANGAAVANQTLSLSAIPEEFDKGRMNYDSVAGLWVPTYATVPNHCPNEDVNRNGILDAGEDSNGDTKLTPGNVAVMTPSSVLTNSLGRASFELQYGKPYATWVSVRVLARATVAGTESSQSVLLRLPSLLADVSDSTLPPTNENSPYGLGASCTDLL